MAMDTKPKYRLDAGTGVAFSAKMVRSAMVFQFVTTVALDEDPCDWPSGSARAAGVTRPTTAASAMAGTVENFLSIGSPPR
jgi:hypothetical protein